MNTHNGFDGFGRLISMVKRDSRDEMMEDMGFNNAVHDLSTDETKLAVYGRSSAASKIPSVVLVVRQLAIRVLKVCDGNCLMLELSLHTHENCLPNQ